MRACLEEKKAAQVLPGGNAGERQVFRVVDKEMAEKTLLDSQQR